MEDNLELERWMKLIVKKILKRIKGYIFIIIPFTRFTITRYKINKDTLKYISKKQKVNVIKLFIDYMISSYCLGCTQNDYICLGLYRLNNSFKRKYVLTRQNDSFSRFYNGCATKKEREIFKNKGEFNRTFERYVKRKSLVCNDIIETKTFIENTKRFFAKPIDLCGGEGIKLYEDVEDIDALATTFVKDGYLLEECLKQHNDLSKLNESSINTIRPTVIKSKNGDIKWLSCVLRVGKKGSIIDNLSKGGVMYPVDIVSGKISGPGYDKYGNTYINHPDSNIFMLGFQIPNWEIVRDSINYCMSIISGIRMVGWDICIQEDGIELIEGNIQPGPNTFQIDHIPKREYIFKKLIKMEKTGESNVKNK